MFFSRSLRDRHDVHLVYCSHRINFGFQCAGVSGSKTDGFDMVESYVIRSFRAGFGKYRVRIGIDKIVSQLRSI